jgi:hypothetical protein
MCLIGQTNLSWWFVQANNRVRVGAGLLAAIAGLSFGLGGVASADPPLSTLVANPTAVSLDLSGPTTQNVTVNLDSNCLAAFKVGQTYTVTATITDTGVATVSPGTSVALYCGGSTGPFQASFTVTAVCPGTTTLNLDPVAGPPGIQKKLSGTQVPVSVTDVNNIGCNTTPPPPSGHRPAAPAVANAYLDANSSVTSACKSPYSAAKNAWRGALISSIAAWMPTPESVKDNLSIFPTDADWIDYVTSEVNHKCGLSSSIPDSFDPTPFIPPLVAYTP